MLAIRIFILNDFNVSLPFSLLDNIIPKLSSSHADILDNSTINNIHEHIRLAKTESGFIINELGDFSELLADNATLTINQSAKVIEFIINIGEFDYFDSVEQFKAFSNHISRNFEDINCKANDE